MNNRKLTPKQRDAARRRRQAEEDRVRREQDIAQCAECGDPVHRLPAPLPSGQRFSLCSCLTTKLAKLVAAVVVLLLVVVSQTHAETTSVTSKSQAVESKEKKPEPWTHDQILDAIWFVEASRSEHPLDGDGGKAIGPYQIHRAYFLDAKEWDKTRRTWRLKDVEYEDCRKRDVAVRVVKAYMARYAREAWSSNDAEVISRVHNGGPRGMRVDGTKAYWSKVKAELEKKYPRTAKFV